MLNVKGAGIHSPAQVYTDEIIRTNRLSNINLLLSKETFRWNDSARADLKDYNLLDLSICTLTGLNHRVHPK